MSLFALGKFTSHSGVALDWRIECDALTDDDWRALAEMAYAILPPFSTVIGIATGGTKLQYALQAIQSHGHNNPRLIVDDVLTTGASMIHLMTRPDDIGLVVFARGPLPYNVYTLFAMPHAVISYQRKGKFPLGAGQHWSQS